MPSNHVSIPPLRKAYLMNQSKKYFGVFAEIGAGQEVSRTFFNARMASNTIAKSMCAYAKEMSDDIYLKDLDDQLGGLGNGIPYTVRFRLMAMLKNEHDKLFYRMTKGTRAEAIAKERGDSFPCLFTYANTFSTGDVGMLAQSGRFHGWMGVRVQCSQAKTEDIDDSKDSYIDVLAHVVLLEQDRRSQYNTIGMMGVNMIHAACTELANAPFDSGRDLRDLEAEIVEDLFDEVDLWKVRIDVLEINPSPALQKRWSLNNRRLSVLLVHKGLSHDTLLTEHKFDVIAEIGGYKQREIDKEQKYRQRVAGIKKWLSNHRSSDTIDNWAYPADDLQVPSRFLAGQPVLIGVGRFKGTELDLSIDVPLNVQRIMKKSAAERFPLVLLPYTNFSTKKTSKRILKDDLILFEPLDKAYSKWKRRNPKSGILITRSIDLGWGVEMLSKSLSETTDPGRPKNLPQLLLDLDQWLTLLDVDFDADLLEASKRVTEFEAKSRDRHANNETQREAREDKREAERERAQLSTSAVDCLQRIERSAFVIAVVCSDDDLTASVANSSDSVKQYVAYLKGAGRLLAVTPPSR